MWFDIEIIFLGETVRDYIFKIYESDEWFILPTIDRNVI